MSLPIGMRKVLVTGGGSGIGRAVALAIAAAGGQVLIVGRRRERLEAVQAEAGSGVEILQMDLVDDAARAGLVRKARDLLGGLDGLVHAAGDVVHELPGFIDERAMRAQLELNLVAPLRLGEEALALLDEGGGVVFVSSTLAKRPVLTSAVYSAAKAGLQAAMSSLALAGAGRRIRFNAVAPGLVDTEMVRSLRLGPGEPAPEGEERERRVETQLQTLAALAPLGRLGEAEEVARAILHLLGAPFTTGATLTVDGGLLLRE